VLFFSGLISLPFPMQGLSGHPCKGGNLS
jgi:hypothetical protein